jgi:NAD(P)-dependent dehydrogenase (short-subunit alcohol dehydrogenase family)
MCRHDRLQNPAEKVALVTGGAQGIGRATALALLAHGYQVAVADVKRKQPTVFREDRRFARAGGSALACARW